MKQIKLTKPELERLLNDYTSLIDPQVERLVDVCKDLDHANEDELLTIYNAFCSYLGAGCLRIYRITEFNSLEFENNVEQKQLTENIELDDVYFALNLSRYIGYQSFNDLNSFLTYRIPLNLNQINNMLEYTFENEEDGE